MPVIFTPNGFLDVATDPGDLPSEMAGKAQISGAMTRCTNLHLDRMGIASTRRGSTPYNSNPLETPIHRILEQGGYRYAFAGTKLYRNEAEILAGLTSATWYGVLYQAYNATDESIFALNGTDRRRITGIDIQEWGIEPPANLPVVTKTIDYCYMHSWELTEISATAKARKFTTSVQGYETTHSWEEDYLNGVEVTSSSDLGATICWWFEYQKPKGSTYGVKYTYCRKNGDVLECESNPSGAAYAQIDSGCYVTWIASPDPQVTHVRVYRTLEDTETYLYEAEYAIGTTSMYLSKQNEELGTQLAIDHDRPPLGGICIGPAYNGVLFILKDNLLYYSKPQQPEYWPALNYVVVSPPQFPLNGARLIGGQVFVSSTEEIYQVQGTGAASFFPLGMGTVCGTKSPEVFGAVKGMGLFHLGGDGLYAFSTSKDQKVTGSRFEPIFWGTTVGSIPGINRNALENCWLIVYQNKVYFGFPGGTSTYPDNLLVIDQETGRTVHYQYNQELLTVALDLTNDALLAGDENGIIWKLENLDATLDDTTAITWQIESKEYTALRKYFPRYAKYDVALVNGASANGYIILDGVSKQTHALTISRRTKSRHIATCAGDRLSLRLSGTGPVNIYSVEAE